MIGADRLAHTSRWRYRPLGEKALLALGLLALALALPPWPGGAFVLAVAVGAALMAGTPPVALLRLAAGPAAFILSGVVAVLVELHGWDVRLAADHGAAAGALALRAGASVACLLLLAVTSPAAELIQGLRRLGVSAELAELALVTYRFVFVLHDEAMSMHAAQGARLGHQGWRRRIHSVGILAAALLPRALDRAQRLEMGLAARGFDGTLRTLTPPKPPRRSALIVVATVLMVVGGLGAWL